MFTSRPHWLENWTLRHQSRVSLGLHLIGIPLTVLALILGAIQLYEWQWALWWRPFGLLTAGYALQWIGHLVEGNDMGEIILLKKMLGRPYVSVSPRYQALQDQSTANAERA